MTHPQLIKYWRTRYQRKREKAMLKGLSAHGTPYKRAHPLPSEREARRKALALAKYHRRAERRKAAGLNSRGQPYKHHLRDTVTNPVEIAWRQFKTGFTNQQEETI